MIHVLAEVAMVGAAFLGSMGGIISAVEVEQDVHRAPLTCPFLEIGLQQHLGQRRTARLVSGRVQP